MQDDNVVMAEQVLRSGNSAFHKLGLATVSFIKAALGLEAEEIQNCKQRRRLCLL